MLEAFVPNCSEQGIIPMGDGPDLTRFKIRLKDFNWKAM
jgi:hypothetical protein